MAQLQTSPLATQRHAVGKAFLPHRAGSLQQRRGHLQIQAALSRQAKEQQVERLEGLFKESTVVIGMRYQGLTVKQMQEFRRALPKESTLLVCKNTLVQRAADAVEGWSELKAAAKGDNAWLFVQEDYVAESVKAYLAFEKQLRDALPKEERESMTVLGVNAGAMDGKLLDAAEVRRLEKLPTKQELIATIARLLNQLPTKVARGINQVPTKLAYGVKALADGDDNKEQTVGDVFPKAA